MTEILSLPVFCKRCRGVGSKESNDVALSCRGRNDRPGPGVRGAEGVSNNSEEVDETSMVPVGVRECCGLKPRGSVDREPPIWWSVTTRSSGFRDAAIFQQLSRANDVLHCNALVPLDGQACSVSVCGLMGVIMATLPILE